MWFLLLLSRLPLGLLYGISWFIYVLMYYIIGYRKKVVKENLALCFPEKTLKERNQIAKQFYKRFADTIVEIIKVLTISETEIKRRTTISGHEPVLEVLAKDQGYIAMTGHCFNWEWMVMAFSTRLPKSIDGLYKPLASKFFDKVMRRLRSRFGTNLIPTNITAQEMFHRLSGVGGLGIVADQSPPRNKVGYWTMFLGRETAFYSGTCKFAKLMQVPIFNITTHRVRRGHYTHQISLIAQPPYPDDQDLSYIIERFVRKLEQDIRDEPANWLWSHKRWKHGNAPIGAIKNTLGDEK